MSIKRQILIVATLFPISCLAQIDSLTDLRDNKKYRIKTINNTTWMLDNLDYQANYSVGLTEEQKKEQKEYETFLFVQRHYVVVQKTRIKEIFPSYSHHFTITLRDC